MSSRFASQALDGAANGLTDIARPPWSVAVFEGLVIGWQTGATSWPWATLRRPALRSTGPARQRKVSGPTRLFVPHWPSSWPSIPNRFLASGADAGARIGPSCHPLGVPGILYSRGGSIPPFGAMSSSGRGRSPLAENRGNAGRQGRCRNSIRQRGALERCDAGSNSTRVGSVSDRRPTLRP